MEARTGPLLSSSSPMSPALKRAASRAEATSALDSLVPDATARMIYQTHDAGERMSSLLAGGAPSDAYEASIGVGRHSKEAPPHPPQPLLTRDQIREVVMADRVAGHLGGSDPGQRMHESRKFEPKLMTGSEIKQRQQATSVFLHGPEDSPALRTAAAQSRPVLSYQLERPALPSSYGSSRGQQNNRSSIFLGGGSADSSSQAAHAVPPPRQGSVMPEERARAMAESGAAAKSAAAECSSIKQRGLTQQFTLA